MLNSKYTHLIYFVICLLLTACKGDAQKDTWVEGIATITVDTFEEGHYWYTITYDASQSTAVSKDGKPIKGPIAQHGMETRKPIDGQKVKMRYMREEPIILELLEPRRFEK
jgi:hypothetical protein